MQRYSLHHSYLNISEPGWRSAMPHMSYLTGFSLPTIGCPPHLPMVLIRNGITRIPKIWRNAGIGGIFDHPAQFTVFNLPANFSSKLEIDPLVINRPTPIGH